MICFNCNSKNLLYFDNDKTQCKECGCILNHNETINKFLRIYFAHPLGTHPTKTLEENLISIENHALHVIKQYPYFCPLLPTHNTGFMYNIIPYELGMMMCFKLLEMADMLVLCGDWKNSKGCQMEKLYAEKNDIKVMTFKELCFFLEIDEMRDE